MKYLLQQSALILLGFALQGSALYAETRGLGYLPSSWYTLPEEAGSNFSNENSLTSHGFDSQMTERAELRGSTESASKSLQNVMYANERALEKVEEKTGKKWYLDNIRTSLAVSAKGLVGIMSMKGTAAVKLSWRPRSEPKPIETNSSSSPIKYDVAFSTGMDKSEIRRTLEPAIQHAIASGRIRKSKVARFRNNLIKSAEDFHFIVSGVKDDPEKVNWFVRGFMLEAYITASGDVTPFINVATEVRLRFIWHRIQRKNPYRNLGPVEEPAPTTTLASSSSVEGLVTGFLPNSTITTPASVIANKVLLTNTRSKLTNFLSNMTEDLELASHDRGIGRHGFYLKKFRVGLAVGVKGGISAAKVKTKVYFYALFGRPKYPKPINRALLERKLADDPYMYIVSDKNAREVDFAKAHEIPFEEENPIVSLRGRKKSAASIIYKIKRKYFRKGIAKAYKMTNYFVEEATKKERKKWAVYNVEAQFELSLTGLFGISRLSGIAAARVYFARDI